MPRVKRFDKEEVLNLAMELFWKKGFHATSMQNLVDHLGINRASIYDTYGGKESLFNKAFERYRENNKVQLMKYLASQKHTIEGLKQLFKENLRIDLQDSDRKGCMVVNTSTELSNSVPAVSESIRENHNEFVNIFREAIELAMDKNEVNGEKDAEALAEFLFTFYNGIKVIIKTQTDYRKLSKSVETAFSIFN